MPNWQGSTRRISLPKDWDSIRRRVFARDGYRCRWINEYDERCDGPAEECDHIGSRWDHSMANLQSLCSWHHQRKSSAQGAEAKAARLAKHEQRFRRREEHPGAL